jgi:hypothetical protein
MTAPAMSSPYTASWLLSGDRAQATQGLARVVQGLASSSGVLGKLSSQAVASLNQQLTETTYGMLQMDLGELLQDGWRRHPSLVAAAHATVNRPAATELVELAKHTVSVRHHPAIDVHVNGVKLATIALELMLVIEVDALLAKVRQGRLVELQVGRCAATGVLLCESVRLVGASVHLDPAFVFGLGNGLVLVREAVPTTGGQPQAA